MHNAEGQLHKMKESRREEHHSICLLGMFSFILGACATRQLLIHE